MSTGQPVIVAIPVRNEEQHLQACLTALLRQTRPADVILLLLNNCADGSLGISQQARTLSGSIHIIECALTGANASAGEARRRALNAALELSRNGVILTTDADTITPQSWIADNLAEIARGADCVCGMAVIAPEEDCAGRPRLEFDVMREWLLHNLQDEIAAVVDPNDYDPWPRHQQHSGASIAVKAAILRAAGGPPRVAAGEDRELIAKLAAIDAKIRHAPHIQVTVSGREVGRAAGGMAETIMRRLKRPDRLTDETLEPTIDAYRRVLTRVRLRAVRAGDADAGSFAADLGISRETVHAALQSRYFGTAWDELQRQSPILQRRRVAFFDLARETRQAFCLRDELRATVAPSWISLIAE